MPIRDYQATPGANTAISGIDVRENVMVIQAANDVIRQMMADAKELQSLTTMAAAATMAIGAANAEAIAVTSSGPITVSTFDNVAAGVLRELHLQGAVTFTHNPAVLILTGADLAGVAGDVFTFRSLGAGVWRLVGARRVDGTSLAITPVATPAQMRAAALDTLTVTPKSLSNIAGGPWLDVTSAATTDLGAVGRENVRLLGAAAISSLGSAADYDGVRRLIRAASTPSFVNSATLVTGTGSDLVLAAGDTVEAICLGGTPSVWMLRNLQRASAGSGTLLRTLSAQFTGTKSFTTGISIPRDNTQPLITEGNEIPELAQTITLAQATNKVRVQGLFHLACDVATTHMVTVWRGSTYITTAFAYSAGSEEIQVSLDVIDTPGVVGPHVYTFRVGTSGGSTQYVHRGTIVTPFFGTAGVASLTTLTEIAG